MNAVDPNFNNLLVRCREPGLLQETHVELERLGRQIRKAVAAGRIPGPVVRIRLLSSFLTDMLADVLLAMLLRHGVTAEIAKGPYGAIATELLGVQPREAADLLIVLPTHRDLAFAPAPGCTAEEADAAVAREAAVWIDLWRQASTPIVQLTFDPPHARPLAEADGFIPGGRLRHVRRVNQALADAAPRSVALVDAEALAGRIGRDWHDARLYQLCKQPFAPSAAAEIADTLAATVAGVLGKSRKVLALDLDNTLWGGVIGDMGLDGIELGQETAQGEAFIALQNYAKSLAGRGVILAVCSKNQPEIALEAFRAHPAMVLKEEDIACFVANFEDKATNLRRIARSLNVGLDSIVFVDDNPVERAWIARELPDVLVPDLPEDPAHYCRAIENAKAFPMQRLTEEDVGRNRSYRARAETIALQHATGDIDSFLKSLEPRAVVEPVGPGSLDRIVQLVAKTNQFKLNPTTFTAEEVAANPDGVVAMRFKDKLQDYGITAVAVTALEGDELVIRNWVMSCRVFSRRLEHATLELIRERASRRGVDRISLQYTPSKKNGLVADVLNELGFQPFGPDGRYVAPTRPAGSTLPHHIAVAG